MPEDRCLSKLEKPNVLVNVIAILSLYIILIIPIIMCRNQDFIFVFLSFLVSFP